MHFPARAPEHSCQWRPGSEGYLNQSLSDVKKGGTKGEVNRENGGLKGKEGLFPDTDRDAATNLRSRTLGNKQRGKLHNGLLAPGTT